MPLLQQTEDWQTLTSLILQQAPQLAQQGRLKPSLSGCRVCPILCARKSRGYFTGWRYVDCHFRPLLQEGISEKAYNIFKAKRRPHRPNACWCTIVFETFTYEFADVAPLDHWIAELEFMEKNPFSHRLKLRRVLLLECSERLSSASLSTRCSLNGRSG